MFRNPIRLRERMGLDISMYAEGRSGDGGWKILPAPCQPDGVLESDPHLIPLPRNSALFCVLSGTYRFRSGLGELPPISPPRGLPEDLSEGVAERFWHGSDDPSWLSAEELAAWDWDQTVRREAMVHPDAAFLFADNPVGFPTEGWPEHVPRFRAAYAANGVPVRWRETLAGAVNLPFLKQQLGELWGKPEVRLIFWYVF